MKRTWNMQRTCISPRKHIVDDSTELNSFVTEHLSGKSNRKQRDMLQDDRSSRSKLKRRN